MHMAMRDRISTRRSPPSSSHVNSQLRQPRTKLTRSSQHKQPPERLAYRRRVRGPNSSEEPPPKGDDSSLSDNLELAASAADDQVRPVSGVVPFMPNLVVGTPRVLSSA